MNRSHLSGAGILIATVLVTATVTWQLARSRVQPPIDDPEPASTERKVLYWYDPMYPQQRFEQPGKSPFMDMDLVPKYADEMAAAGVAIDPRSAQNIGLRLATVERMPRQQRVIASGVLGFDERAITIEQARSSGFVDRVWPLAPGDVVHAGQPLLELRAPEWAAAEREYVLLREHGEPELLGAASQRLLQLGLPPARVRALQDGAAAGERVTLHASTSGVVQSLDVRAGMTLMTGQTLLTLAGLDRVWLELQVPEAQASWLEAGVAAQVQLAAFPGQSFAGAVDQVLPMLADASRSLRLRIALDNAKGQLRPGMTAQVELIGPAHGDVLAVPSESVIRTGQRSLVLLVGDEGRFQPVEVIVGNELGERTEIISGVEAGQQVVASGQFLIDSEASLSGVIARNAVSEHEQDDPHADHATSLPELHEAEARVEAIEGDRIRLAHGPFKSLGMPGMTMRFRLDDIALVKDIAVGDRVRVFVRDDDDALVVARIEKMGEQP
ncbi:MAG TPA: efflux RND transporter periplasmic adaptor subunit [Arenimonas sp.]|nr:efflux RND transporter periplasmic adaptor subunit [Arenimonas sp.]